MLPFTRKKTEYVRDILLYDFSSVASRLRRIFNYHCQLQQSLYDWKHYQDVQKVFDKIDHEMTARWTHGEPFSFFFDAEEIGYRYIDPDHFEANTSKPLNDQLFKISIHTTWLQSQFIRFRQPIMAFSEALQSVWQDAQNIVAEYKKLVGPEFEQFRAIDDMPHHFDELLKFFIYV